MTPTVSLVIVTFNGWHWLEECLAALRRQTLAPLETLVVDNGSSDGTAERVAVGFPEVTLIRLPENLGYAGGNNAALRVARGEYVALLNDDTEPAPGWLEGLVSTLEAHPDAGMAASIIHDAATPGRLDSVGVGIALDGMSRQASHGAPVPALTEPVPVLMPSGCACLIRRAVLAVTGLFDESFFAYCEDTDLGLRIRMAGWKCLLAPGSDVVHKGSMTGGKFSLRKIYLIERNHFWVALKNFPLPLLLLVPVVTCWRYLVQAWLVLHPVSATGRFARDNAAGAIAGALVRAHRDVWRSLPRVLRYRWTCRRNVLGGIGLTRLIWRHRISMRELMT